MQRRVFLSVLMVAVMGFASMANAQEEKKEKGRRGDPLMAALEKANLSEEQKTKVKAIMEETDAAAKAAREAKDREAGQKVRAERMEKINAVLTEEQREIVKKYMAELREKSGKGKPKQE